MAAKHHLDDGKEPEMYWSTIYLLKNLSQMPAAFRYTSSSKGDGNCVASNNSEGNIEIHSDNNSKSHCMSEQ